MFGTGHAALYAVLIASSSAALILPVIDSLKLTGAPIIDLLPQVALADAAGIVALPLAIDPSHAQRAALGALAVIACAARRLRGCCARSRRAGCAGGCTACPSGASSPSSCG